MARIFATLNDAEAFGRRYGMRFNDMDGAHWTADGWKRQVSLDRGTWTALRAGEWVRWPDASREALIEAMTYATDDSVTPPPPPGPLPDWSNLSNKHARQMSNRPRRRR